MWLIDSIAAFFLGALSGMGIGGGGLLVIYLTLLKETDQITAQGLNLYFFLFASIGALFLHYRKRKINYSAVLILAAFGMPAALFGSFASASTDPGFLRMAFGFMLIITGSVGLIKSGVRYVRQKKKIEKK